MRKAPKMHDIEEKSRDRGILAAFPREWAGACTNRRWSLRKCRRVRVFHERCPDRQAYFRELTRYEALEKKPLAPVGTVLICRYSAYRMDP